MSQTIVETSPYDPGKTVTITYDDTNGYTVTFIQNGNILQETSYPGKSYSYAQSVAENYFLGVLTVAGEQ